MYLLTAHRTVLSLDASGTLSQARLADARGFIVFDEPIDGALTEGPLKGFHARRVDRGVTIVKDGMYLCAESDAKTLVHNRKQAGSWETFVPVSQQDLRDFSLLFQGAQAEVERFSRRVSDLQAAGLPVKVYCGCGDIVRPGFIHLDIEMMAQSFAVEEPQNYYLFPFADRNWGVPDNSIDYVFHEDVIEHLTQLQQIQLLAEVRRVLRPGSWHRINTPNLLAAMRRHSSFDQGYDGVYTGERDLWGHINLLTPSYLQEIAAMVGYREIVFTTKSHGVSPHACSDLRPLSDRDPLVGNIYADLLV